MGTFIGIISGTLILFYAALDQGGARLFLNLHAAMIVIGGLTAALFISYPLPTVIRVFGVLQHIFRREIESPSWVITLMVRLAKVARQHTLLKLDDEAQQIQDKTIRLGVSMVVDGHPPEVIREVLEVEIASMRARHRAGERIFRAAARLAPAFGLVGTLIGLIAMLRSLGPGSAQSVGPGMAVAMVATFYGVMLSNLLFQPVAEKLRARSEAEALRSQIILDGILMVQAGTHPRVIELRLNAYLPLGQSRKENEGGPREA
ncbi:MAG: MotA/TolQ/ExbB proton channel family protein [Gammaproteobacteria bacterium]|nr:MotA/TolQ/ExbB proton channel family protein [Gammaproteobacteria bacterium]